jgi:hypothetical protein
MRLGNEHGWFKRSRQLWKLRVMWTLAEVTIPIVIFVLWTQWRTQTINIHANLIVLVAALECMSWALSSGAAWLSVQWQFVMLTKEA